MGVKCKFCVTRHGNNKYVANVLVGLAGCGKCNGSISRTEKMRMLQHCQDMIIQLKKDRDSIVDLIKSYEDEVSFLNSYEPVRE